MAVEPLVEPTPPLERQALYVLFGAVPRCCRCRFTSPLNAAAKRRRQNAVCIVNAALRRNNLWANGASID